MWKIYARVTSVFSLALLFGTHLSAEQSSPACTFAATITVSSTSSQGTDGVVSVTTNPTTCTWNAYSTVPWIQLNAAASTGQGSGLVPFIVASNPGTIPRTGQILIANVSLSLTQDAGPAGIINGYSLSVVAGGGSSSTPNLGDGGPAIGAFLNYPTGLAFDPVTSNLYIVDTNSSRVRLVTPDGNINTFAGGGSGTGENIPATSALLSFLGSIAVDSSSAVYIQDSYLRVRRISQGNIVTFAGGVNGFMGGFSGDNGPAIDAKLTNVTGLAADSTGTLYISDLANNRVRKVTGGTITTFAGGGINGFGDNGPATLASLTSPSGLALDASGNLLIADTLDNRVRKVAQGIMTTIAGGGSGGDGPATSAGLYQPSSIAVDTLGAILIEEGGFGRMRKVSVDGTISTITNVGYASGMAPDRSGNLFLSDGFHGVVRKLTALPSFCTYLVSTPPQIPPGGGSVQISITAAAGCRWGALLLPTWLSPTSAVTGIANGAITFTASPNSGTTSRSATLAIAGMTVPVTQSINTAALSILKTHVGNFFPGQQNATYTITVSNAAGAGPTAGLVAVTDTLPFGLIPVAMAGSGWTCQNTSCTRSDVLAAGASYPAITMTVNVAANATSPQVNQVSLSGGGSSPAAVSDSTIIFIPTPTLSVNRTTLNFANSLTGIGTSPQTVTVSLTGGGVVLWNWNATSDQSRIVVSPGSGAGNGSFQVSINNDPFTLLHVDGTITVTAPGTIGSPKQIQVHFIVSGIGNPIGSFDTPVDNTTGVAGAIPVTGWALDDVEISKVEIWRDPVGSEPAGALIYLGNAVFVDGARPDVEAARPGYPFSYRAGWGYQLLTNFLPQGNGTFKLHAIAYSKSGPFNELGTKTITVDNIHATKPFGTLDTPGQGGNASGNAFVNFGWALCPNPNKIPIDGSTISVIIDGQVVGHPTYNQFRSDIATLFPGFMNSGGAVGFFYLDTTKLSNGVHTISWNVYDNAGHGDGIGSRYFNVFNTGNSSTEPEEPVSSDQLPSSDQLVSSDQTRNRAATVRERFPNPLEIEELALLELPLNATTGYQLVNGERRPLPIGSSLKRGVFYWQPGPGFLGEFHLIFERKDGTETQVHVKIRPKTYPQEL
jgi:uncharacterized repeat protein (TIGR01451 family)